MNLILTLSNPELLPEGHRTRQVEFGVNGGTVGRSDSCDWMLDDPDRFVSSRHIKVSCKRGVFHVEDTSTNGTFLNDALIGKGNKSKLDTGSVLRIGRFLISAQVVDDNGKVVGVDTRETGAELLSVASPSESSLLDDPEAPIDSFLEGAPRPLPSDILETYDGDAQTDPKMHASGVGDALAPILQKEVGHVIPEDWNGLDEQDVTEDDDPFDSIGGIPAQSSSPEVILGPHESEHPNDLVDVIAPDPAEDYEPVQEDVVETIPEPEPEPEPVSLFEPTAENAQSAPVQPDVSLPMAAPLQINAAEADSFAAAFLQVLGLPEETATATQGALLGQVMATLLDGTIDLVKARADIRNELRLRGAGVTPRENNPLKFSLNAQDAALRLGKGQSMGFQEPRAAAQEVMQELNLHNLALLTGIDAGVKSVLDELNPKTIGQDKGVLGLPTLMSRLSEQHAKVAEDTIERTGGPFWRAFSKAYQQAVDTGNAAPKTFRR